MKLTVGETVIVASELDARATALEGMAVDCLDHIGAMQTEISLLQASAKHYTIRAALLRRVAKGIRCNDG
jgi:hypothetical protein